MPDYVSFVFRFAFFALVHSLFATNRLKRAVSRAGASEPRSYRLIYNLASTVTIIWVMSAWRNSPVLYYAPGIYSLILYLAQVLIAAMLFIALKQTGAAEFLGLRQLRSESQSCRLTSNGWYGIVRHPLYLLSLLFMILNPVMTAQWLLFTILTFVYFIIGAMIEEKRLLLQFGEQYEEYCRQVPFLIPSFRFRNRSA